MKIKTLLFIAGFAFLYWLFLFDKKETIKEFAVDPVVLVREKTRDANASVTKGPTTLETPNQFDQHYNSLPTLSELQGLTFEEVHHTPEVIKKGGEILGKIHEEAEQDESKRVEAMNFFKACAEDQEVATAIRAVCLSKILKLIPEWRIPLILDEDKISKDISELALKLP